MGLRRPHRVWHVPRRFYELYANNGTAPTDLPLAKHKTWPANTPELAYIDNAWPTLAMTGDAPIPDGIAALGRWGYYASVSFTDWNVGRVLAALRANGFEDNTVVLFTGDHGWELGEHGEWCKRTNWEVGLRVPYIVRSPRHAATSYGRKTAHLAESVDFYRTLAGLALPAGADARIEAGVDGVDLSPVFAQPNLDPPLKTAAFSQMARCPAKGTLGPESACNAVRLVNIGYMGFSARVDGWRYTAWLSFNGTTNRGDWDLVQPSKGGVVRAVAGQAGLLGEELYDHAGDDGTDFDAFENVNLASAPEHKATRDELLQLLKVQFS